MRERFPNIIDRNALGGRLAVPGLGRLVGSRAIARPLQARAEELEADFVIPTNLPELNIVIDARRKRYPAALAEDWAAYGKTLTTAVPARLDNIRLQKYPPHRIRRVMTLVEDGFELTALQQRQLGDTEVIPIASSRNHPQGLNTAIRQIGPREGVTMLTDVRAHYVTDRAFRAAVPAGTERVAAVFGTQVPDQNTPLLEAGLYYGSIVKFRGLRNVDAKPAFGAGYASANRGGFNQLLLHEHSFDERYGRGGADGEWGERMATDHTVLYDPALSVRFAQGAGTPSKLVELLGEYGTYIGSTIHYDNQAPPRQ
ncbi:MAG TPA: hypothetical protein VD735_02085 [Candidatus Saccharimonadales bacterium]|nr:hypothetical protein [Candidatus Saccharimonadales bacterium]